MLDGDQVRGLQEAFGARTDISHNAPDTSSCQEENTILGLPGASPAAGVTDPQGTAPRAGGASRWGEEAGGSRLWLCWPAGGPGTVRAHRDPPQPAGGERPQRRGPQVRQCPRACLALSPPKPCIGLRVPTPSRRLPAASWTFRAIKAPPEH